MKKKVLFCATVDYHFTAFHMPYIKWFKDNGWEVHIAANGENNIHYVDKKFNLPIQRSPFNFKNIRALKDLKNIIDENNYEIIHCHTPMGGILARLAARKSRAKGTTKLIYTAHGFHFCKGAPILNWLLYYPIEKFMAPLSDCLITINKEDYELSNRSFNIKRIVHIHGVGIDTEDFKPIDELNKKVVRESFGYQPDDFLLFYAAEFNKNKNQQFLLNSLALMKDELLNVKLLLAGEGALLNECKQLANQLGISHMVEFLGFRKDIKEILPMCDVAVGSSLREGLPVNIMEAMSCGLPIIAVDNRGHRELVINNKNGWLVKSNDSTGFSSAIKDLAERKGLKERLGANSRKIIMRKYSIDKVILEKSEVYKSYMKEMEDTMWATL
ncbi:MULTISPECIES: glycosyltransferase family 4 protein [Bacillaceae]|uniref:Glycosyl transferase n=1 Tax=Gottfriedia luciferensis TaxID=178774 RepID=A0ABX2ZTH3_9BACI|nr:MULTISPECIES: glycosyltransferase family 4 protein [Bacillaceae]ODG91990.1 glycosyl transferase [Gottfriedia luciferensis]PGZ87584.1 glycosyltransferase family 1 protein [Bacillus sp. AFS029533]